jgi:prephenate dehydrogenase
VRATVAIAGLGLIGGSLARALRSRGWRVIGLDRPSVMRRAKAARAISEAAPRFERAAEADLVVLAAYPRTNLVLLRRLASLARPGLTITDVGSVKARICVEAARLGLSGFVGGHPMAGSERSGFEASSAALFRGRPWILTPAGSAPRSLAAVRRMIRAAGARPAVMEPEEHDRVIAFLSHLPQIAAWALRDAVLADEVASRHTGVAGPAFADMTRVAKSPVELWRKILAENRTNVERALEAFKAALTAVPGERRGKIAAEDEG